MFVGSPGVGKTHLVERTCANHKRSYMRIQSCTDLRMLEYLERCSIYGMLAVVDDADCLWGFQEERADVARGDQAGR